MCSEMSPGFRFGDWTAEDWDENWGIERVDKGRVRGDKMFLS